MNLSLLTFIFTVNKPELNKCFQINNNKMVRHKYSTDGQRDLAAATNQINTPCKAICLFGKRGSVVY